MLVTRYRYYNHIVNVWQKHVVLYNSYYILNEPVILYACFLFWQTLYFWMNFILFRFDIIFHYIHCAKNTKASKTDHKIASIFLIVTSTSKYEQTKYGYLYLCWKLQISNTSKMMWYNNDAELKFEIHKHHSVEEGYFWLQPNTCNSLISIKWNRIKM